MNQIITSQPIYIYIYRERERERERDMLTERERGRGRERERERDITKPHISDIWTLVHSKIARNEQLDNEGKVG